MKNSNGLAMSKEAQLSMDLNFATIKIRDDVMRKSINCLIFVSLLAQVGCNRASEVNFLNTRPIHDLNIQLEVSNPFMDDRVPQVLGIKGVDVVFKERPPHRGMYLFRLIREEKPSGKVEQLYSRELSAVYGDDYKYSVPDRFKVSFSPSPNGTALKASPTIKLRIEHDPGVYEKGNQSGAEGSTLAYIDIENPFHENYTGVFVYGDSGGKVDSKGIRLIESELVSYWIVIETYE